MKIATGGCMCVCMQVEGNKHISHVNLFIDGYNYVTKSPYCVLICSQFMILSE